MANPTPESPAGKTPPPPQQKPSLSQALFKILKDPEPADSDPQKTILRRRRFVMAAVLGTLGVNFLMFLRFFFPRALYEPKTKFTHRVSRRISDSVSTPNSRRTTASGWSATPKEFS